MVINYVEIDPDGDVSATLSKSAGGSAASFAQAHKQQIPVANGDGNRSATDDDTDSNGPSSFAENGKCQALVFVQWGINLISKYPS